MSEIISVPTASTPTVPACTRPDVDPELFFSDSKADIAFAKAICRRCPLQMACLQGAIARGEHYGVFGGRLFTPNGKFARSARARKQVAA